MCENNLIKIRSIINREIYYTSKKFPLKEIDGKKYLRVLRFPKDTSKIYMTEDKIEYVGN